MNTTRGPVRTWALVVVMLLVGTVSFLAVYMQHSGGSQDSRIGAIVARTEVQALEQQLWYYKMDTRVFPSTEQGLQALLTPPKDVAVSWNGPYLADVPVDPWGMPYQYEFPTAGSESFALYSLGADSAPGGEGINADIGILPGEEVVVRPPPPSTSPGEHTVLR